MALPRLASDPTRPSFAALVESVSKDIRPRAILDEWKRRGIATVDADDHAAAAGHNLTGAGHPMLERSVYYMHIRSFDPNPS